MRLERFFQNIAYGERSRGKAFFLNLLLFPLYLLSLVYRLAVKIRLALFRYGLKKSRELPCHVISVGNLTVGGTGKTPVVEYVARQLVRRGLRVAILSRGYKGNVSGPVNVVSDGKTLLMGPAEAGDEPYMLARRLETVPVVVGSDRYETGRYAIENFRVDAVVLDDGFQHIRLKRDVNILLVDGDRGFGNGHVFPRGPLREPVANMDRAHIVVVTKCRTESDLVTESLKNDSAWKLFKSNYKPLNLKSFWTGKEEEVSILSGKRVLAMSGIANPSSFAALLDSLGGRVLHEEIFADHHAYSVNDLEAVMKRAESLEADMVVTTEKDAVKIEELSDRTKMPFYSLQISLDLFGDDDRFVNSILSKCGIRET